MESGDSKCGAIARSEDGHIDSNRCLGAEEASRSNEEGKKSSGGGGTHGEKTKGQGLRRWKRRPRKDQVKEAGPHQDHLRTLKRELFDELAAGGGHGQKSNHVSVNQTLKGDSSKYESLRGTALKENFTHGLQNLKITKDLDRISDSGSWNARGSQVGQQSDDQSSKSSVGTRFPKVMPENFLQADGEIDSQNLLVREGEEIKLPLVFDFGSPGGQGDEKRSVGTVKKARGSKARKKCIGLEDPARIENGICLDPVPIYSQGHSANHNENVSIATVSNKQHGSVNDNGDSIQSTGNNFGKGSSCNGVLWNEDKLWAKNSCYENESPERGKGESEEAWYPNRGETDKEAPSLCYGGVSPSQESIASIVGPPLKKREDEGDSEHCPGHGSPQSEKSDCLDQAIMQLQTTKEALHKELQRMKHLADGIEVNLPWNVNSQNASEFDHNQDVHVHEHGVPEIESFSRPELEVNNKQESWQVDVGNLSFKVSASEQEIEGSNEELSEFIKSDIEIQCQRQDFGEQTATLQVEDTALKVRWHQETWQEVETELEEEFKKRMQAEMESLILREATKDTFFSMETELCILHEQKKLLAEQLQIAQRVKENESPLVTSNNQAKGLEDTSETLSEKVESKHMRKKIYGFGIIFLLQLILMFICFVMFMMPWPPQTNSLVPT
eukprot:TRINITY_DN7440_c0_g1_i1.p1 TRINITY_DN7440_c0_g1~~TRINITY_DN7440_c0_g1_i1.p1  ORF type:complete len:670 (-),score=155.95 TRINITY_DN7440_c0_g1_i1:421-2430(-)